MLCCFFYYVLPLVCREVGFCCSARLLVAHGCVASRQAVVNENLVKTRELIAEGR